MTRRCWQLRSLDLWHLQVISVGADPLQPLSDVQLMIEQQTQIMVEQQSLLILGMATGLDASAL